MNENDNGGYYHFYHGQNQSEPAQGGREDDYVDWNYYEYYK